MIQLKITGFNTADRINLIHVFDKGVADLQETFSCDGNCPCCECFKPCRDLTMASNYLKSTI